MGVQQTEHNVQEPLSFGIGGLHGGLSGAVVAEWHVRGRSRGIRERMGHLTLCRFGQILPYFGSREHDEMKAERVERIVRPSALAEMSLVGVPVRP